MKKSILIGFTAMIVSSLSMAEEIKWYSWEEGIELSKKEDKPMMIFVYATWCHVCKKMSDKTFRSPEVSSLANQDFIPVKLDIDLEETYDYNGKRYSGKELLGQLASGQMMGIPSTIFYFPEQNKKYLETGYKTVEEFVPVLSEHKMISPE